MAGKNLGDVLAGDGRQATGHSQIPFDTEGAEGISPVRDTRPEAQGRPGGGGPGKPNPPGLAATFTGAPAPKQGPTQSEVD